MNKSATGQRTTPHTRSKTAPSPKPSAIHSPIWGPTVRSSTPTRMRAVSPNVMRMAMALAFQKGRVSSTS
jgi:hypothetical protein